MTHRGPGAPRRHPDVARRAAAWAIEHCLTCGPRPVDECAAALRVSRRTLQRELAAGPGVGLREMIRRARLDRGCRILDERPGLPVGDVADQVGYADAAAFTRAFRAQFGMTPAQYRTNRAEAAAR
jgi:AraC-like DNA-binding protein